MIFFSSCVFDINSIIKEKIFNILSLEDFTSKVKGLANIKKNKYLKKNSL